MSGTIQSAKQVATIFEKADITIVDSKVTASCLGLLALQVAEMAQQGATKKTILKELARLIPETRLVLVMDTMNYLYRGGRIG